MGPVSPQPRAASPIDGAVGLSDMLDNVPAVKARVMALSSTLRHELSIPARLREAIVLHLARRHDAEYEWGRHVPLARSAGLSVDEIRILRDRPTGVDASLARVLRFVDQFDDEAVGDDLWRQLEAELGVHALVEVSVLAAYYLMMVKLERVLHPALQAEFGGFESP